MATDWGRKDPDEVITYGIDFASALATGDSLQTAAWTFVEQAGCTKSLEAIDGTTAKVRISAGTHGEALTIQCRVTTAGGEILEENAKLKIRNTV